MLHFLSVYLLYLFRSFPVLKKKCQYSSCKCLIVEYCVRNMATDICVWTVTQQQQCPEIRVIFSLNQKTNSRLKLRFFEVKAFVLKLRWRTNSCLCFSDQSVQEGGNCKPSSVKQSNQVQGNRHSRGVSVCIAGCLVNVCKLRPEILIATVSLSFSAK